MANLHNRLLRLILFGDQMSLRILVGIANLAWGVSLLWPGDTFEWSPYRGMRAICGEEETWGAMFLIMAVMQFVLIWKEWYDTKLATVFAFANCIIWWFVTISMYRMAVPNVPAGISGDVAVCIAATWVFVLAGWNPTVGGCHAEP